MRSGVTWTLAICGGCALFPSLDDLSGGADATSDVAVDAATDAPSDAKPADANAADAGDAGSDAALTYRATILADKPVGYWRLGGTSQAAPDELGQHSGTPRSAFPAHGQRVAPPREFQGALDEVAIYDFALSASQVKHHYAVGTGQ